MTIHHSTFENNHRPNLGVVRQLVEEKDKMVRLDFAAALDVYDDAMEQLRQALENCNTAQARLSEAFEIFGRLVEAVTWRGRLKRFWAWVRRRPNPYLPNPTCPHGYAGNWSDDCPDCRH